jgi:uncharacterized protein YjbI with pentapeptide repeats
LPYVSYTRRCASFDELKKKNITLKYNDTKQLEYYFRKDKSDWYTVLEDGNKKWDKKKVSEFWKHIRNKTNSDYNNYAFPEFEMFGSNFGYSTFDKDTNFWKKNEEHSFTKSVNFAGARFLDDANFNETLFLKEVSFKRAIFEKGAYFLDNTFNETAEFGDAKFKAGLYFRETLFLKKVYFEQTRFSSSSENIFSNLNPKNSLNLVFYNCDLSNVTFKNLDLSVVYFRGCNLIETIFTKCRWDDNFRFILQDEKKQNDEYNYSIFAIYGKRAYVNDKELERLYQQFKINFGNSKKSELSDKSYISEMVIRKKILKKEKKFFHYFIYWYYGTFGGYTFDFKRPIFSLFCLIIIFSLLYLFIDDGSGIYDNISRAAQRGIKGTFPYLDINIESPFSGNWLILKNIQSILGVSFTSFFLLGLRNRFKK